MKIVVKFGGTSVGGMINNVKTYANYIINGQG